MSADLDRICRGWCPLVAYCETTHYCSNMRKIKQIVIEIANQEKPDE